ncbi:hypothetical protein B0T10DRAFT_532155 [Thelonectria olida]|uniref:Rhodopsin domain-containing protein n=1 Tax=Thelonectria olida TaxID=1576542 RepID=A0A9P9AHB5_9HYPO|nr:hypothetical protein B0T10DRAFT_532155 [Thelonectria olida]
MIQGPTGEVVLAVIFTLIGIAACAIAARIYLRVKIQKRKLVMSDFFMIAAWFCACTAASFDIVLVVKGVLRPEIDWFLTNLHVDVHTYELVLRTSWGGIIPYYTTFYLCKASLLSFYLQLFPRFMKRRRILLWVAVAYCSLAYVVTISLQLFLCFPVERNWSVTKPEHMCDVAVTVIGIQVNWVLHITGSISLFVIPFLILHNLQMPRRLKISVCSVFLIGLVDIAFSLARFFTIQLSNAGEFRSMTLVELWAALDAYIGLVVACLPSLRPYLRPGFKSSSSPSYEKSATPARSVPSHLMGQSGFQEIDDELYPGGRVTVGQEIGGQPHSPDWTADYAWNDDKKSNRSDIELVPIASRAPTNR